MWLELQIFGFRALWSPYILGLLVLAGLVYYVITGPKRHLFGDVGKPSIKQQFLFYGGLALLYLIKGSPIDLMSHHAWCAHDSDGSFIFFSANYANKGATCLDVENVYQTAYNKSFISFFHTSTYCTCPL